MLHSEQSRKEELGKTHNAPPRCPSKSVAIVGMSLALPGEARDAEGLWAVLEQGMNTLEQIPSTRFNISAYSDDANPGGRSMNVTKGNFIRNPDIFDHSFFQISPREARSMDPQQRILLQLAHDALENAGYCPKATPSFDPDSFGAYIGVATNDYVQNLRDHVDVYYSTGTLQAFLSGRLSYAYGLGGPSMVLDTACSSSLVSIHQACRALTAGDCNAALAGGVNIISSPDMYLGFAKGHFLSETGQCRPWDASADGYCRSEGCGLFVLKRLDDALAENDRILGIIRGTEVNQSGNARSITQPHVPAQAALFHKLVSAAGVDPLGVSVAECHGTGTQAGDPAELEAVRQVFAVGRTDTNPLHITSIKANIGHTEAASGAASLAKLLLMLRHRTIPRHISFSNLNPRIPDLSLDNVRIDTTSTPWNGTEGKARLALLTNFGASGSNSALILEERIEPPRSEVVSGALVIGLSCKSSAAAEERRKTYMAALENVHDDRLLQDFAYSATARRQLFDYRIAASGKTKLELLASLRAAQVVKTRSPENVIFVFSGQGSQYPAMGRDLYQRIPAFARIVNECHRKLMALGAPGILDVFDGTATTVEDASVVFRSSQAALFVLEYALARMWMSWGVHPCAVLGHSFGEFAALAIAGVISLDDALLVVSTRADLLAAKCTPSKTGMTSVRGAVSEFSPSLSAFSHLEVCCYNSEGSFVIGGDLDELSGFEELCAARQVRYTRLDVPYAYHSAAMDPVLADLEDLSRRVSMHPPTLPFVSTVTGALVRPGDTDAFGTGYLARHCREPARFQQGLADLVGRLGLSSVAAFIEVGPHPATLPLLKGIQEEGTPLLLPSLRRTTPGIDTVCAALAQLYNTSVPVQWRKVFADLAPGARLVDLPAYPFAQTRFWVPYEENSQRADDRAHAKPLSGPPPLDPRAPAPRNESKGSDAVSEIALEAFAELIQGHQVAGMPLCPASVYVELVLSAAVAVFRDHSQWGADDTLDLVDITYPKPLIYVPSRSDRVRVGVSLSQLTGSPAGSFTVTSTARDGTEADVYCKGTLKKTTAHARSHKFTYAQASLAREVRAVLHPDNARPSETFTTRTVYELLFPAVVAYSGAFRTIQTITVNSAASTAYAVVMLPQVYLPGPRATSPVFVDTLFHVAGFLVNFTRGMNGRDAYICTSADALQLLPMAKSVDASVRYGVYAAVAHEEGGVVTADVCAFVLGAQDGCERIVARLKRVRFSKVALAGFSKVLRAAAGQQSRALAPSVDNASASPVVCSTIPRVEAAPRDGPEPVGIDAVKATLSSVLEIPVANIADDADIGSLGLDSLSSIEARHVFKTRFGVAISEDTLTACQTVRDIADSIARTPLSASTPPGHPRNMMTPQPTPGSGPGTSAPSLGHVMPHFDLIQVQHAPASGARQLPLVLVHDGSGTVGGYQRLGTLGRDVWAIRNVDFARVLPPAGGWVHTMAEAYAGALCSRVFPNGNAGDAEGGCVLGGWSFGGVVALELARELLVRGVQVRGLVLIDAPAPQTERPMPEWLVDALAARLAVVGPREGQEPEPLFADLARAATRALVAYTPPTRFRAAPLRAVYLRAREVAAITLPWEAAEAAEVRARAFLSRDGTSGRCRCGRRCLEGGRWRCWTSRGIISLCSFGRM
ncbi:hypothetical protein C2E23DRAFT_724085 [Lenzites betulinus]|nr:hypothetical protein C2E23DRAFT_724085 [Lenzites betulinus]